MSFEAYNKFRRNLLRGGLAAASLSLAWHLCPKSDENPLAPGPEHAEQHDSRPINVQSWPSLYTSASSNIGPLDALLREGVAISDHVFNLLD